MKSEALSLGNGLWPTFNIFLVNLGIFTTRAIRSWLSRLEVGTLFVKRGGLWENGYIDSFNSRLRDELLNTPG